MPIISFIEVEYGLEIVAFGSATRALLLIPAYLLALQSGYALRTA